jgi:hypothetical protein
VDAAFSAGMALKLSALANDDAPPYATTIEPRIDSNSMIRSDPFAERGRTYWYTTELEPAAINCYEHATRKNDGYISTDVWYHITRINDPVHGILDNAWSWGET